MRIRQHGPYLLGDDGAVYQRAGMQPLQPGGQLQLPAQPSWRGNQVAPGVMGPRPGLEILPMTPQSNGGVFSQANGATQILFTARPQRPFRPERLVVRSIHAITAGNLDSLVLCDGLFVGTKPNRSRSGDSISRFSRRTPSG